MRQCIFVIGSREQLLQVAPLLRLTREQGLRHSVWIAAEVHEPLDAMLDDTGLKGGVVLPNRPAPRSQLAKLMYWMPISAYRCFSYVHGVKTWTTKSPLIVVHGDGLSTRIAAHAGRWGGGQLVHLQHTTSSQPTRKSILKKSRFAFCRADEAGERSRRYPGCKVVGVEPDDASALQTIVESLLRWTGGKSSDA